MATLKDLSLSVVVSVLLLALGIGLVFHWVYPRVEPSNELAGLFFLVAVVLRLTLARLLAWRRKAPPAAEPEARK
ncbi:MAG: hypothetical protein Q7U99_15895 [Rubrivivax sp.]|nr:hypothetical protein [Rubrivivax sp.]MDP3223251.1 hypothetical protein [Rubrivivax sp.]